MQKADIGKTIAIILLVTLRPLVASHITKHTNMLQRIAKKMHLKNQDLLYD
jgi:hypothetical protein